MKKLYILGIVGCVMAGLLIYLGFVVGQLTFQPKVVEVEVPKIEYITVTRDVPSDPIVIEIPVPYYITVVEEKPYEVIVYRNIYPRSFGSVASFKAWWKEQDFKLLFNPEPRNDYDDYAEELQVEALKQGFSISQALARDGKYYGIKVTDKTGGHVGNLVLIKNTYYWVEPNPEEFEVIKLIERD